MYELVSEKLDLLNKLNKQLRIVKDLEVGALDDSLPKSEFELEKYINEVKEELNYR